MARCATRHPLSRIKCTRLIPSFPLNDRVPAKVASQDHRDPILGCCQHRAPTPHSKRTSQISSKEQCNNLIQDSPRPTRICNLMDPRMRLLHQSWAAIRCDQAAYLSESPRRLPTPSPQPLSSLRLKHRQYRPNTAVRHSRTRLCNRACRRATFLQASTPTLTPRVHPPPDLPRIRTRWADR